MHTLANNLSNHIHDQKLKMEEDRQIVENFVDASNSQMRAIHGYSPKLREHVRLLYNHILRIAGEIPPPIHLTPDAFRTEPLINALFVNSNEIDALFQTNHDVDVYLRKRGQSDAAVLYALLTAGMHEKKTLGMSMQGDTLIRDVPQQAVNFSAHQLHIPCADSVEFDSALKKYLFDRVVALVKQEMRSRMSDQIHQKNISYELRISSLANPEVYLKTLIEYIEHPDKLLGIEKTHFKLSKLGIKLQGDDRQCANEFDIYELVWSGNTRHVVAQIAYVR